MCSTAPIVIPHDIFQTAASSSILCQASTYPTGTGNVMQSLDLPLLLHGKHASSFHCTLQSLSVSGSSKQNVVSQAHACLRTFHTLFNVKHTPH